MNIPEMDFMPLFGSSKCRRKQRRRMARDGWERSYIEPRYYVSRKVQTPQHRAEAEARQKRRYA